MIRKLTLALAAVVPLLVLAAPKPADKAAPAKAAPDAEASGELALPAAPLEGGAKAVEGGKAATAAPDTYTIRPGDTLWDLSGRFLNNPWYWPKIWSYNPDINNPHWISPGNMLRFYPTGEEGAVEVVPVKPDDAAPEVAEEDEPVEAPRELDDLSRADMKAPASEEEKEAVSLARPIGFVPPRTMFARRDAFVTRAELEESGVIKSSFSEKFLLTKDDAAYVAFKNAGGIKVGDTFSIYRTIREVKHPVTKESIGFQTVILGTATVVAVEPRAATISIAASYDYIERGDRLGPGMDKPYRAVVPKANARKVSGVIVGAPIERITQMAESQYVFVDKGKAEGVEEGNSFTVLRSGDPTAAGKMKTRVWDPSLPEESIGRLLVIDVKEHTSAALVMKSLRELNPGDLVEMKLAEK